ncbi:hypothetical protein RchiOBHm_Chr7g0206261 [Rosa chinensis]|uniref:Uncharacterized protein n=1 Tax=Rosa chinensis TaxID=74649 RepID=A0A2P6P963_ROSCH|nr:uncharacterized protein LOC121050304 [Rosa chinensis]PRQ18459.1 hypothetical protein RchiOBHm_Chr7g0206261 [Rosa chinensis]
MISEQNRPQDQIELTSMQELLSKKQEKDAATVVNSNVSIASQKFSHHVLSNLSELVENNIKVQGKMQKLLENKIKVQEKTHKLLENNIKEVKTLQVQENLLKELADTIRNPVIEKRPMPIIGPCGEREYDEGYEQNILSQDLESSSYKSRLYCYDEGYEQNILSQDLESSSNKSRLYC